MQKNKRKETSENPVPLIAFEEIIAERESFRLSWTVIANLREYVAYVKDVTGKDATRDEVVDRGLQRLFDADKGFRRWMQRKNGESKGKTKSARTEKPEKPSQDGKQTTGADSTGKTIV
jgi:hypothetical protein